MPLNRSEDNKTIGRVFRKISLLVRAQVAAAQGCILLATQVSDGVRERRDLQSGPNRETTGPILGPLVLANIGSCQL